jgi:pimeloyl-ACP methyl ester carboxylesterase
VTGLELHDFGGEGPDLLLLHGGGDNLETWRDFAPLLRRDFHIYAYDARGHGRCLAPDVASVEIMVQDVVDAAGGLERPVVVGHSMGGINALLAASLTDGFRGIVALDAVPRWWSQPNLTRQDIEDIARSRGLGWTGTEEELEARAAGIAEESPHADLIQAVFRRNHVPNGDGRLRRRPEFELAVELAGLYRGPDSGLTAAKIEAARCPVLLLCSEEWVTSADARRTLEELTAEVQWMNTSHYLHWDNPAGVADRVRGFACAS